MPYILLLETSTASLSVALMQKNKIVSFRENTTSREHAALLLTFVDEVLSDVGVRPSELSAIAVSKGPGSYTGLRIGVSSAKGLCYSLNIPLIGISPLQALAVSAAKIISSNGKNISYPPIFCAMADAGRMEVYAGIYDLQGNEIRDIRAEIVNIDTYHSFLQNPDQTVFFVGDGAEKCADILKPYSNAVIMSNFIPNAKYMADLAFDAYKNSKFEDTAYFTPFYLKDFIAKKPNVKGLY